MTSFAVLMQYTEYNSDTDTVEGRTLMVISYIGCAVSLLCLIATFAVFIYLEYVCLK